MLKAIATFDGGLAHYNMLRENEGIYQAILEKYDGKDNHHPPKKGDFDPRRKKAGLGI